MTDERVPDERATPPGRDPRSREDWQRWRRTGLRRLAAIRRLRTRPGGGGADNEGAGQGEQNQCQSRS